MATKKPQTVESLVKAMSLKELRKVNGVTLRGTRERIEKMTGERLSLKDVRDIESGKNDSLLKIAAYVEALGGKLEVHTVIPISSGRRG